MKLVTFNIFRIISSISDTTRKSKKFKPLLEAGKKLFWKYGIRKVSIQEICEEAGVSKMTFYRLFENKVGLIKVIFEEEYAQNMQQYLAVMNQEVHYSQKIKEVMEIKIEGTADISEALVAELFSMEIPEIQTLLTQQSTASMQQFMSDFQKAQDKGEVRKDIKPEFFLLMQKFMHELIKNEQVNQLYPDKKEALLQFTQFFFWGIAGQPDA